MTRPFASGRRLRTQSIRELLDLGYMGLQLGYVGQAEAYFDTVLRRVPDHPRALLGKAKSCQDPVTALAAIRRFIAIRPANREAHQLQAELYAKVEEQQRHLRSTRAEPMISGPVVEVEESGPDQASEITITLEPSAKAPSTHVESQGHDLPDGVVLLFLAVRRFFGRRRRHKIFLAYLVITTLVTLGAYIGLSRLNAGSMSDQSDVTEVVQLAFDQLLPSDAEQVGDHASTPVPTAVLGALHRAAGATAMLTVPAIDGALFQGSGIILTAEGLVMTNYHVMTGGGDRLANPEGQVFVGLTLDEREPPSEWYIATAVVLDVERDLAILRVTHSAEGMPIKGSHFVPVLCGQSDQLHLGQSIMGLGYPALGGDTLTLTRGSMAGYLRANGVQWGKTDSELLPGSSGGAVLDDQARLIGVITLVQADESTKGRLSYFVLLHEAQELIDEAMRAPRPSLDVSGMIVRYAQMRKAMP